MKDVLYCDKIFYFISVDVSNDASRNLQTEDDKDRDEILKQTLYFIYIEQNDLINKQNDLMNKYVVQDNFFKTIL